MASLGKFHYYSTAAPQMDVGFGYPIMQAPPDKAIKIVALAMFNLTNSANTEMILTLLPNSTSKLADGTYSIVDQVTFNVGLVSASIGASTIINPVNYAALPAKGGYAFIIIPPGAILLGYPSSTSNLNGTIQWQGVGYECEIEGNSSQY